VSAEPQHKLRIRSELSDDQPYLSVVCPFEPTDPTRPCAIIDCRVCGDGANRDCLAEHGATAESGCNIREWANEDGIAVQFLVELPIAECRWTGDGYDLIVT
jgi:hypothetical protein